ncbi:hypothetical protein QTP88_023299 [Uroleucon formosanum]
MFTLFRQAAVGLYVFQQVRNGDFPRRLWQRRWQKQKRHQDELTICSCSPGVFIYARVSDVGETLRLHPKTVTGRYGCDRGTRSLHWRIGSSDPNHFNESTTANSHNTYAAEARARGQEYIELFFGDKTACTGISRSPYYLPFGRASAHAG